MDRVPAQLDVEGLHLRLCERITGLRSLVVADVMRVFLEVSSLPCEKVLWSFEFAFDEDDSRIARLEARFAKRGASSPSDEELTGYEVHVHLPKVLPVLPARPPADVVRAAIRAPEGAAAKGSLVARFVHALGDLGAYQAIATIEARAAEVYLV